MKLKRIISALLLLAMLLSCLPLTALAAETETPDVGDAPLPETTEIMDADSSAEPVTLSNNSDGFFYLAATAADRVIIAPERVTYAVGQTIAQALLASGHTFDGLEDGNVYRINGVAGEFQRSDETGDYSLTKLASAISFFCFTEGETAKPSETRQTLIRTMADYLCEEADVRAYAKDAYDAALRQFVGISDEKASSCATQITAKIGEYKTSLGSTTSVTFSGTDEDCTITAVSTYGKVYDDTEHPGTLNLPDGSYDFTAQKGALAKTLSAAPDYPEVATAAIEEMYRQVGPAQIEDDVMQRGMIVRHLVLPGCVDNSLGVLDWFSEHFHGKGVWFSLMSQYVPMGRAKNMPPFDRHITENEYAAVCSYLELCNIENGYTQDFSSAIQDYIPKFDLSGL